jgi:hypothetical protein
MLAVLFNLFAMLAKFKTIHQVSFRHLLIELANHEFASVSLLR